MTLSERERLTALKNLLHEASGLLKILDRRNPHEAVDDFLVKAKAATDDLASLLATLNRVSPRCRSIAKLPASNGVLNNSMPARCATPTRCACCPSSRWL